MKLTATQRKILELWAKSPASRTRHRLTELRRLVKRDLTRTAKMGRRA